MCIGKFWMVFRYCKRNSKDESVSLSSEELREMREKRINFYETKVNPIDRLIRKKRKEEDAKDKLDEKVENLYDKVKWE